MAVALLEYRSVAEIVATRLARQPILSGIQACTRIKRGCRSCRRDALRPNFPSAGLAVARQLPNLLVRGKPFGASRPASARLPRQSASSLSVSENARPAGVGPGQAVRGLEGLHVGQPAVLVALQPHAAAARHLGHLLEREDQHLAVLADRRDQLALDHRHRARLVGRLDVEHLLALAGVGEALVLGDHEAPALMARDQELAPALIGGTP